jgi:exopolysaccharide biosynthesis WecB/TagA/CpsF family protein
VRILLVHNYYGAAAPSGENVAFELERDLLRRGGHEVRTFCRSSDELRSRGAAGLLRGAAATPWNPWMAAAVRREVEAFRPDVVHAHNTFPLLSPAIFPAVGSRAARVLTLHNYRLFCPAAIPQRGGLPCTECLDRRSVLPALRHGCYRGSRAATAPLALNVALARAAALWRRHVEAFIALTPFQRDLVVAAGLPADRVHVKPNFYPGRPTPVPWPERREVAVFVGRLSEEKGLGHLLEAWGAWGDAAPTLRVVGDGPLRGALEARARALGLRRVEFLGRRSQPEAEAEIGRARLLVLPSTCFEGFPMVLREALALGTPAAVSALGPLPGLVEEGGAGVTFGPGDPASLLAVVRRAWDAPGALEAMGAAARRSFEARYAEEPNLDALLEVYDRARAARAPNHRRAPWREREFMGYRVFARDAAACATSAAAWVARGGRARWLACLNPHSHTMALDRPELAEALRRADWLVPDGVGITIASRILGAGIPARVTGSDVFEGLSRRLDASGGARVFFLGASRETLAAVTARYRRDYPRLEVVGALAPPFREDFSEPELHAMAAAVNAARPDVLWVGLGSPKQELVLHRLRGRLEVRFAAAVGAVFDFYAGRVRRAHPVIRRLGLEWLARLLREPRRLWRRMVISAPVFLWHVALARLGRPLAESAAPAAVPARRGGR